MIPIIPNGELRILENIPFDREHTHTCLFGNETVQAFYMRSNTKLTVSPLSYARYTTGSIKIQASIESLYNCNYMMFKNTAFENKWFYAFILNVEYVNNNTCRIDFEIDVLQTWLFDFELGECFVEREHSVTDAAGDNITPENVELGDYVLDKVTNVPGFYNDNGEKDVKYALWSTLDSQGAPVNSRYYSGYLAGAAAFDVGDGSSLDLLANLEAQGLAGAVIALSPYPRQLALAGAGSSSGVRAPEEFFTIPKSEYCFKDFEGYTPKNNKLYTYPYNYLYMSGFNGSTADFVFEYFTDVDGSYTNSCPFNILCQLGPNTTVGIAPGDYKGVHYLDGQYNYDEMFKLYTFPQMPFGVDTYKNEAAGGVISSVLGGVQTALNTFNATGSVGSGVLAGLSNISFGVANTAVRAGKPVVNKGSWDNLFLFANNLVGGWYARKHIKKEFAQIIDNYFSMFGYSTNRLKTPNINSRPHWNYVKTRYCFLNGNLPESAESEIRACFNRGITFWKNPGEIGNYSLDNSPT